jgi:hypothetical protein
MKKRALLFLFVGLFFLNICYIDGQLGITPAITKVYFQPNMSFFVNYNVLYSDSDTNLIAYADGDLAEYVKIDKNVFKGQEGFTVYVDLPFFINKSGQNKLYIKVKEYNKNSSGIGVAIEVGSLILVKVPYPGKYGEINLFNVNNINEGESINFYLELNNLGEEELNPEVKVEVYSDGKLFGTYFLGTKKIAPNSMEAFSTTIKETKYKQGSYDALAYVYIDNKNKTILMANKTFYVGNLMINVINWTGKVSRGKISPYIIQVESKWNNNLKNVFAEVNVSRNEKQADFFKTPSIELKKWEISNLQGFFNAENLKEGLYKADIILYYENMTTKKNVDLMIYNPNEMIKNSIIFGVILFLIIALIIFYFIKRNRKYVKKYKK